MEKKGGRSLSVEGGNPASEDLAKSHGLEDAVHPVHADPIISMEEIQTHQEARELVPMENSAAERMEAWPSWMEQPLMEQS